MPWIRRLGRPVPVSHAAGRPLRVLLLPRQAWPEAPNDALPGAHPAYEELFEHMAAAGVEMFLAPILPVPWNPLANSHAVVSGIDPLRAIRIMLAHRDFDAVLGYFESPALPFVLLRRLLFYRRPIVIADIGLSQGWAIRDRILDLVVPRLDGMILLGANQADAIRQRWRTGADLTFIHQHVDSTFFAPGDPPQSGPVLTVGDDAGRDFPTLLAAMDGIDLDLVAKTASISDDDVRGRRIRVLRGRMDWPDYRALFEQALIVVVPLRPMVTASGIGTLLEAMSMGKALIVSDSPGIRDHVVPDETALVVPSCDPDALRGAILRLQSDPALRLRLGQGARAYIEAHCSYRAVGTRMAEYLRARVAASA